MQVVVATMAGRRMAERLRDAEVDVRAVVAPAAPARVVADAQPGAEAAELLAELARCDVLMLAAERSSLTSALVAACDRWGVRIVALHRRDADRRFAESFGLVSLGEDADPVTALAALAGLAGPAPSSPRGRVITVWGAEGAPGRSTIAVELACELARDGRRVGLADADSHAPSMALALGVADEGPGFAAACRQAARGELTPAELTRIAVPLGEIEVLPGINRPGRWPELAAERVASALEIARDWVDDLVVDVAASLERDEEIVSDLDGPRRNAATLTAIAAADLVVAVVAADPVGVSRFVRAYPDLRATAGSTPVHVVVNKTRPGAVGLDPRGQVRRTLERFAGIERVWFVPWDPRAADAALLAARPIAHGSPRSAIPAAVRRFVGEAVVPPVPAQRRRPEPSPSGGAGRSSRRARAAASAL